MDNQINRSIIASQKELKAGVPMNYLKDAKNIAFERMAPRGPLVDKMDYEDISRKIIIRMSKNARLVFQKISPDQSIARLYFRGEESSPYLVSNANPLEETSRSIEEREKKDKQMKKWIRRIKSYLSVLSKSRHLDDNMVKIFDRQFIKYSQEEFPRLKMLALQIYPTIADIGHVQEKAYERGINVTSDEVTKICWTIRAYDDTIHEVIEGIITFKDQVKE